MAISVLNERDGSTGLYGLFKGWIDILWQEEKYFDESRWVKPYVVHQPLFPSVREIRNLEPEEKATSISGISREPGSHPTAPNANNRHN